MNSKNRLSGLSCDLVPSVVRPDIVLGCVRRENQKLYREVCLNIFGERTLCNIEGSPLTLEIEMQQEPLCTLLESGGVDVLALVEVTHSIDQKTCMDILPWIKDKVKGRLLRILFGDKQKAHHVKRFSAGEHLIVHENREWTRHFWQVTKSLPSSVLVVPTTSSHVVSKVHRTLSNLPSFAQWEKHLDQG